jgi:transketolase
MTDDLCKFAQQIRMTSLDMISKAKSSHVGSVFSSVELLAALYGRVMRVDPDRPEWPDRDRFVMSKGHACAGLYAALALRGFFPERRLREFYIDGGSLAGHVTHRGVPGVEVSTGALGHGLALAVGLAKGAARKGAPWNVYCLLSDGECDEGSIWEAALLAPSWGLTNLTVLIDYNKIQSLGRVEEVIPLEPFADKWRAFGWAVTEIDGHDVKAVVEALQRPCSDGRPHCVIAHTVKGKGVSFMEDELLWHYRSPQGEEYVLARRQLSGGIE